jgi:enoyl-CoA hydratase/carnithine racemase
MAIGCCEPTLGKTLEGVIAMIKGYCIGGGMVIASACDMRIAAEGSRFGVPAGKLGLGYEIDNLARLQGIIGSA